MDKARKLNLQKTLVAVRKSDFHCHRCRDLLVVGVFGYFSMSGGGGNIPSDYAPRGGNPTEGASTETVDPNMPTSESEQNDQSFWAGRLNKQAVERSPGNLNNQLSAQTTFGLVLMLILTIEAWGEGSIRRKSQQGASFFTLTGLLGGWTTMAILSWASKAVHPGWVLIGVVVVVYLWTNAASTIKSQSDLTPFLVTLAIFTTTLFYYGKFVFITTLVPCLD
jgi:hypothetical protein